MITLTNKTTVELLILTLKQNYGKAWYSRDGEQIVVGLHSPTGEIAYRIPAEFVFYLNGMIELPTADTLDTAFGDNSAERLLEWTKQL